METIPELRAELIRLQAAEQQAITDLKGITMGTREFGQGAARVQNIQTDYKATQKRLIGLLQGGQPSLF